MKILIVEDDQVVANIYRNKLTVEGYEVEVAHDGERGLALARSFRPDAMLLDLMLPQMPGIDVMKALRAEPDFKNLPIIIFSNTYLTNMVQEAWKAGATKCLSKAVSTPKHVIEAVRSTLGVNGMVGVNKPAPAPSPAPAASKTDPADTGNTELTRRAHESIPAMLPGLRAALQNIVKAESENKQAQAKELYRRIHLLTGNAGITGMTVVAQMADAVEALVRELCDKPRNINASTLRTVANAIDFLGVLIARGGSIDAERRPAKILVVDDEVISRRALSQALEKANLSSVNVEDPLRALTLLEENEFDLIFLDVDMPNMTGFELCTKLRALPAYKKTPVVFVTGLTDFESRANSTMSGGNDFIAKPFLFMELAVKALGYVLRRRLDHK